MRLFAIILFLCTYSAVPEVCAQTRSSHAELALDYTWMHSNAPPGSCGCFSLQGGSATAAVRLRTSPWSVIGDVTVAAASTSTPGYYGSLRLETFTAGVRYSPLLKTSHRWQPFAQLEAGAAHAGGSLAAAPYPAAGNASATFAANVGGGFDVRLAEHWAIRVVDVQYVLTTFQNNGNSIQNNARLASGVVFRH